MKEEIMEDFRGDDLEFTDAIKLIKDILSIDKDAKEVYSVETYKLKRRMYKTEVDPQTGQEKPVVIEEPLRIKELFDDFRKGFLDKGEYKWVIGTLERASQYKILLRHLQFGDAFLPEDHLRAVLHRLMISGSKNGVALKTILTRFIGKYEHEKKGGLFR